MHSKALLATFALAATVLAFPRPVPAPSAVATVVEVDAVTTTVVGQPTNAAAVADAASVPDAAAASDAAVAAAPPRVQAQAQPEQVTSAAPPAPVPTSQTSVAALAAQSTAEAAPSATSAAQSPAPAPTTGGGSSSDYTGDCPADTSGQHMSPGVNGHPDKSVVDSMNHIRKVFYGGSYEHKPLPCITWSDEVASKAKAVANTKNEGMLSSGTILPKPSRVVSDPAYGSNFEDVAAATTQFERSLFVLLCQAWLDPNQPPPASYGKNTKLKNDSQLQGVCKSHTGEICSSSDCTGTGHHDALLDPTITQMGSSVNGDWLAITLM